MEFSFKPLGRIGEFLKTDVESFLPAFFERAVRAFGSRVIQPAEGLGRFIVFFGRSLRRIFWPPLDFRLVIVQMEFVGNKSFLVIVLAGCMIGGIFGFTLGDIFDTFGTTSMMGAAATYVLSREMAPVTTAMLIAGRAGSAMAAELAIMRVNEQIDAMRVMSVDPLGYLVAPRVLASITMVPLLSAVFVVVGVATAFIIGIFKYGTDSGRFFERIAFVVDASDLFQGLQKAFVFGLIVSTVSCYKGFYASGGAKGVGQATTSSVVISLVLILVFDFFISYAQFRFFA